jgi:hypothetical protein
MPKRKDPEIPATATDKEQSERFIDTAQKLGADKDDSEFKRWFKKVVSPPLRVASFLLD